MMAGLQGYVYLKRRTGRKKKTLKHKVNKPAAGNFFPKLSLSSDVRIAGAG
jgi:hypothetical protein